MEPPRPPLSRASRQGRQGDGVEGANDTRLWGLAAPRTAVEDVTGATIRL